MPVLTMAQAADLLPAPFALEKGAGSTWRQSLTDLVRENLQQLWREATESAFGVDSEPITGLALACVGSLARGEAGPASDLDLVLLTNGQYSDKTLQQLAHKLWYPLWDAGADLDHSVRTIAQCRSVAGEDLTAALGLLDLQHVAGDAELTRACTAALLTDWRKATRKRLVELARSAQSRQETNGALYNLIEPDLKHARGGLRDVGLIRALAASSLSDYQHEKLDAATQILLNTRDALALTTGRPSNRLSLSLQDRVAAILGYTGADARDNMLAELYSAARVIGTELDCTIRVANRAVRPARRVPTLLVRGRRSAPRLVRLDRGVAQLDDEIVLANGTCTDFDSFLPLRVVLASARTGLPVAAVTRASLARCPSPVTPWSRQTTLVQREEAAVEVSGLDLFMELLGCGAALIKVWEDLDLADLPSRWLPGWSDIRNRPQHHPIHLWTVDRHMVRSTSLIPALLGTVTQVGIAPVSFDSLGLPRLGTEQDQRVLLLATFLHDLGKIAQTRDHSESGAQRAPALLKVLGVAESESAEIITLIRQHLLLSEITQKVPGDLESVQRVHTALGANPRLLAMLRVLTEADGRATGPRAWTGWRGGVVDQHTAALAQNF